jgi:predicted alpha/beta hydrolase family esterase
LGIEAFDPYFGSFLDKPFDWQRIKAGAHRILCVAGDNDPYVSFAQSEEIAERLGIDVAVIKKGGHLNTAAGYSSFPWLLEALQRL